MRKGNDIDPMILFILFGTICSFGILFAGYRGMVIDTLAIRYGLDVWEIAFTTYMIFMIAGIGYDMFHNVKSSFIGGIMVVCIILFGIFILQVMAQNLALPDPIPTELTNIMNEFYGWDIFFALLIVVYLIYIFIRRD